MNAIATNHSQFAVSNKDVSLSVQHSFRSGFNPSEGQYLKLSNPRITIYFFSDKFVRPVQQIVDDDNQSSKWFILNEDMKTFTEIDPDQLWFWTKTWQEKEREVDEDLRNGNYQAFDDMDSFIDSL